MSQLPRLSIEKFKTQNNFFSKSQRTVSQSCNYRTLSIPLQITPQELTIKDFQINKSYQNVITVKNLSQTARRIRITQPKTSKFKCDYDMQGSLAAGLSMKFYIFFESNQLQAYHDMVKIFSEDDFSFDLSIHAIPPQSLINFNQTINFGFIKKDIEAQFLLKVKNKGKVNSKLEIVTEGMPINFRISQNYLNLASESEKQLLICYCPTSFGVFKHVLNVKIDGVLTQKLIEVNGTCVDFQRFIIDQQGQQARLINFGSFLYGQKSKINSQLFNNSPIAVSFKALIIQGALNKDSAKQVLTPQELGQQQTQKIVQIIPDQGSLQPFSQIPIQIIFDSQISDKIQQLTKEYAFTQQDLKQQFQDYQYTVIFDFKSKDNDPQDKLMLCVNGRAETPIIKVSEKQLDFGTCKLNDNKQLILDISNLSQDKILDVSFEKIPYIYAKPEKFQIKPEAIKNVIISFQPQKLGKINKQLNVCLVDQKYKIPIQILGNCSGLQSQTTRNNEIKEQFNFENNKKEYLVSMSNTTTFKSQTFHSDVRDINLIKKQINLNANEYLMSQREKKKKNTDKKRYESLCSRFKQPEKNDEDNNNDPPYDYQFYHGNKKLITETDFVPEKRKDNLFVNKPIQGYEVLGNLTESNIFNPDPNQKIRKKFPAQPKSHAEHKDCLNDLSGEMLKQIFAGPKLIDYGTIFIKSIAEKTFHVRNDLNTSIKIKLQISNDELSQSYTQTQIIPSKQQGGFNIIFSSKIKQEFKESIKYIINDKYEFIFQVQASVQPVKLELEKDLLKLNFNDDSQELYTSENLRVFNNGNSNANFQWVTQENSIFSVQPKCDTIRPGQFQDCLVMYYPKGNAVGKTEDEKIIFKVEDGINQTLKCIGIVSDSKCQILESEVNLGTIPVCSKGEGFITIKNLQKMPAIFNISEKLPPYTDVKPMKGKLQPDQSLQIKVFFNSKIPVTINNQIIVQLRGGKEHSIPFSVSTQIPQLSIKEEQFDFGILTTLEESATKIMTIKNQSTVPAKLLLDLRSDSNKEIDGIDCLQVHPIQNEIMDDESEIMKSIDDDEYLQDFVLGNNIAHRDLMNDMSEDSFDENSMLSHNSSRLYIITIKEQKTAKFTLKFMPKDVKDYSLVIPLTLLGYGKLPQLQKIISCIGIKPKFIMRPNNIQFKRKIVMQQQEKCFPSFQDMLITNPENRLLSWNIDTSSINQEKIFQINPTSGRIDGGQSCKIKISFNPFSQDKFEAKVPLYLDNNYKSPYSIINMSGVGCYPKLYFDRREIIMPTVPINIESASEFYIINDGYESLILRHNVCIEYGHIELIVNYCNGNQLGVQNQKLKIEVKFISPKPISFSAKLEFYDENLRNYYLMVSGTADYSILSNYQYIQRCLGEFEIVNEDQKPLFLQQFFQANSTIDANNLNLEEDAVNISKSQKSFRSILGFTPVPPVIMERNLETIKNWLNQNIFPNTQSIQAFPQDLIKHNGIQFLSLLTFLTNKTPAFQAKIEQGMKKPQKVLELLRQYEELIKYLKEQGALLNSVRPHFFLSFQEYQCYINISQNDYQSSVSRITESKFQYISCDAWIQIFYQAIKLFYMIKINKSMIKNIPNTSHYTQQQLLPDYYLQHGNLYSEQETILMRWLEINYEIVFEKSKRLTNLDSDLKNCLHYVAAIKNYIGKSCQKYMGLIKKNCVSEEDYINNAEKLLQMLNDNGIVTHFQKRDLIYSSSRENLLFLFQLIQALPHYIPKGNPIMFECVLGEEMIKEIELINQSSKEINYWVSYDGSNDFSIKNAGNLDYETVKLDPKSRFQYKVKFTSRLTQSVEGRQKQFLKRLTFTNKKDGNTQASALVFELKSNITSRKSIEFWKTEIKLYQVQDFKINVQNIFGQTGNFQIDLINLQLDDEMPKDNVKKNQKKKKKENKNFENEKDMSIPGAFFSTSKEVLIRKGDSKSLTIQFMPFKLGQFKCNVIFVDKEVGEFQHEIFGICEPPEQMDEYRIPLQIFVDQQVKYDFALQFKNPLIQQLRKKHENRLSVKGKIQEKDDYLKLVNDFNQIEAIKYDVQIQPNNNSFIQVQNSVVLIERSFQNKKQSIMNNQRLSMIQVDQQQNQLPLNFQFKNPIKDYSFFLILKNQQLTDIRIFKIVLSVFPKPVKAQIDMKVPLGDEIKQDIPLINPNDKDIQFKVNLEGDNCFSGQRDIYVKKQSSANYVLMFKPLLTGIMEGKLTIINPVTSDTYEYKLTGITEEPIAQDNIIINCKAGQLVSYQIPLQNKSQQPITYLVETDLINPEGAKKITINAHKTSNYNLKLLPVLGGTYTGSITFYDQHNKNNYVWFTVLMQIQRSDAKKRIDIQTLLRKPVVVEIQIHNPENVDMNFDVVMQGEFLQGEQQFYVPSKQTLTYELTYQPLKITKSIGLISFINSKIGEIWYDLSLTADSTPLIKLPMLQAEIGKSCIGNLVVENPTSHDTVLKPNIQNTQNFQIKSKDLFLKAYSQLTVQYQYIPTQVGELQDGEINFTTSNIGDYSYYVTGNGLVPTQFEEKIITGQIYKEIHNIISFKNPYTNPININISIEQDSDAFTLLGKTSNLYTQPSSLNQITFSFLPKEIKSYNGCIVINLNASISWRYPIQGIAEMAVTNKTFTLQTNCKQMLTQQFQFSLPGLPLDFGNEQLKLELGQISKQPSIYSQSLNIKPIKKQLDSADDFLIYEFIFEPMKPFKQVIDLILQRKNGGQWKYKLFLISLEPHIQDTIEIFSELNKTSSVQIMLQNRSKKISKFKAYFQNEMQNDITVSPQQGEMLPSTSSAQPFILSFTPKEYKTVVSKLIIETDEHYWSFIVKGTFKNNKLLMQQEKTVKEEKKEEKSGFFKFKQQSQIIEK